MAALRISLEEMHYLRHCLFFLAPSAPDGWDHLPIFFAENFRRASRAELAEKAREHYRFLFFLTIYFFRFSLRAAHLPIFQHRRRFAPQYLPIFRVGRASRRSPTDLPAPAALRAAKPTYPPTYLPIFPVPPVPPVPPKKINNGALIPRTRSAGTSWPISCSTW